MSDPAAPAPPPSGATGALVLADGTVFWGRGLGAAVSKVGEVCFNTSMSGYQEILTDPSYAGQIITFTFPHIGNVGTNPNDLESTTPASLGCVLRADVTDPSNYRATRHLDDWLKSVGLPGLAGVDTRRLTRRIRDLGAPHGVLCHAPDGNIDVVALQKMAAEWPGLEGMDLAKQVSCTQTYRWTETLWGFADDGRDDAYGELAEPRFHVVAVDYGAKRNILRNLASQGCRVTVVPASTTADEILGHAPDGVFLARSPARTTASWSPRARCHQA